mmetsp:Transcript_17062/g.50955  ORF Transcript_17062/g.50955 Transcript_17062/m.50955 type:complete len:206 (+) Transcript_17062:679-1296(+)
MPCAISGKARRCGWGGRTRGCAAASCGRTWWRRAGTRGLPSWQGMSPRWTRRLPGPPPASPAAAGRRSRPGWSSWRRARRPASFCSTRLTPPPWRRRPPMASRRWWRGTATGTTRSPCCLWTSGATTPACGTKPPPGWSPGSTPTQERTCGARRTRCLRSCTRCRRRGAAAYSWRRPAWWPSRRCPSLCSSAALSAASLLWASRW